MNLFNSSSFHHIGLAVDDIDRCNIPNLETFVDPIQQVKVGFVQIMGCPIELVQPISRSSPVINSLKKNQKLLHLCFEVNHLDEAIKSAENLSFKKISFAVPAVAFEGRRIVWLYHQHWGLIELLEKERGKYSDD